MRTKLDLTARIADFFEMTYEENISYTPRQIIDYLICQISEVESIQLGFPNKEAIVRFLRRNVPNILRQSTSGKRNWKKLVKGRYQFNHVSV